jgi:cytoskeletal protein CcmA (bactofilin family)
MFWRNKKQTSNPPIATSGFSLGDVGGVGANSDAVEAHISEPLHPPPAREASVRAVPGTYVVPAGYKISGPIFTTRPVRIEGELSGRGLVAREVFVAASGCLKQSADVDSLVVEGRVIAPIKARNRIEVRTGGELRGEIESPMLAVSPGGLLLDCQLSIGGAVSA